MDDPPEWAEPWPYWKFGLSHNDLKTTLHDKYNTIPTPIQDPEAFYHDVSELSIRASTLPELEQLLAERKNRRLQELNTMLQDASFEIIANPKLMGTDQWGLAVQLFRTKSFDSLVRYFASYLPSDHPWHDEEPTIVPPTPVYVAVDACSDSSYDGPIMFDEPEEVCTAESSPGYFSEDISTDKPARSMTGRSEDSGVVVNEHHHHLSSQNNHHKVARTMSTSDHSIDSMSGSIPTLVQSAASSPTEAPETPCSSISDLAVDESVEFYNSTTQTTIMDEDSADGFTPISHMQTLDTMDSDTPTPKASQMCSPASVSTPRFQSFNAKLSPLQIRSASNPVSPHHDEHRPSQDHRRANQATMRQRHRREATPDCDSTKGLAGRARGRSNRSRAREVTPDSMRSRARARRRRTGV